MSDWINVQHIAVTNSSGAVLDFRVITYGGAKDEAPTPNPLRSERTCEFPIGESASIDLADLDMSCFQEGTEVWPRVHAILGEHKEAGVHVGYQENGQTATYQVSGGTLTLKVEGPLGGPDPCEHPV